MPASPSPATPTRRSRRRRVVVAVLAGLALSVVISLITLAVWLRSDDFQRRVVPLISALIERQTGEAFDVDRVDVSVWPPAVTARDASLIHPATGETIVTVGSLRAPLVLRSDGPGLGTLTLSQVRGSFHVDAGTGLREFRSMRRGGKPMQRLPWSQLDITDTDLSLTFPDGMVRLTDLTVTPTADTATVSGAIDVQFKDYADTAAFQWDRVVLGPTEVVVPSLDLSANGAQITGRVGVDLQGMLDVALSIHSELPALNDLLGAPRALGGTADVDVLIEGSPSDPVAEVTALVTDARLTLPGAQVPLVHYAFGDVTAQALVTRDAIQVLEAEVCFRGLARCHDPVEPDRIMASAVIRPDLTLEDGVVSAEGLSLAHILRKMGAAPNPWTDFSGDAEVQISGTLKPLLLEGPFELMVSDWRTTGGPVDQPGSTETLVIPRASARGNLAIHPDHLSLDAPFVRGPRSRGRTSLYLGFGPKGPLDLRAQLTQADLSDFGPLGSAELGGTGTLTGRLWGPFNQLQFDGQGDITDFSVIGIDWADTLQARLRSPDMKRIEVLDAVAQVGDTPYTGSYILGFQDPMWMDLDLDIPDGRVRDLVHLFLDLEGIDGQVSGTLDLSGPLFDLDGEAHLDLADAELYGEHFETGAGHGYMDEGRFTLDDLRLSRRDGAEGIVLRGGVDRAWALDMELVADGFELDDMDRLQALDLPLTGSARLIATIGNTLFDPAPSGRLSVASARFDGAPINDSYVDFETRLGVLRYTGKLFGGTVVAAGTLGLWGEQPYSLSAAMQQFSAGWLYPVGADGSPVAATLTGTVRLDGNLGNTPSPVDLGVDITAAEIRWRDHVLTQTGPWHYAQNGDEFELTGIGLAGGRTRFTLTEGRRDATGLELRGEGELDLDLLRLVAPGVERSDGLAQVELTTSGRTGSVETLVDVDISAELFRHESFPAALEDITGSVRATRDGYDVLDVQANLGGGALTGSGRITATDWTPTRWDLVANGRDAQIQWIDELPPAIGDADLRFDGPVDALLLHGDVTVNEMAFTDRIDWEDWVVEFGEWVAVDYVNDSEESWFDLDIDVTAANTVTLRNNVAEGRASASLQFIGSTAKPGLQGQVVLADSIFFLQDREFQVERGLLTWNDPWTWDPVLDFDLATEIRSRDTRYRVNYLVRGPFSDWRTETRSDPPLAQADINALLWFGATTEELEELGELPQALAQGVADFILTDLFITQGRGVTEEIRVFDRVEIVTGVDSRGEYNPDPRLLVEKRYTDDVDITITAELNPVQIDNQLVRAALRLSDQWSLSTWYASQQRDRVLSIGGAYGIDLRARWEMD